MTLLLSIENCINMESRNRSLTPNQIPQVTFRAELIDSVPCLSLGSIKLIAVFRVSLLVALP